MLGLWFGDVLYFVIVFDVGELLVILDVRLVKVCYVFGVVVEIL